MVNGPSSTLAREAGEERRTRPRPAATHAPVLGARDANPFGDLATLQHLSARLARGLRPVFETMLRRELRVWAEPVSVQRFADYRSERGEVLTAWQPLAMGNARGRAQLVLDAPLVLEMLDAFFGGEGEAPGALPAEFTPAAEALVARLGAAIAAPVEAAWEPVTRVGFAAATSANVAAAPDWSADEPVVVTRFGFAEGTRTPAYVDLVYPMAGLKPHTSALAAKVKAATTEIEPQWRNALTRAVMQVRLPVRSVLAEPVIPLGQLLELKAGDVLPIDFGPEVPVMVAKRRLGTGQVGTANGRAAVRLTQLEPLSEEDFQ